MPAGKQEPMTVRLGLVISKSDETKLAALTKASGDNASQVVRRLIRREYDRQRGRRAARTIR